MKNSNKIFPVFIALGCFLFCCTCFLILSAAPAEAATEHVSKIRADCSGVSGSCYTSLSAWEADYGGIDFASQGCEEGDLVCADTIAVAECYNDWPDGLSDHVTIDGWNTDESHYVKVYTPESERHDGTLKADSGDYTGFAMKMDTTWDSLIDNDQGYTVIEGIILDGLGKERVKGIATASKGTTIIGNIITNVTNFGGVRIKDQQVRANVANNLVFNCNVAGIRVAEWGNAYIYNNSMVNCETGISVADHSGTSATLKNNLAYNNTDGDFEFDSSASVSATYNASSDGTADDIDGTGNRINQTFSFMDEANNNFHLASSDRGALGRGTDLSSDSNYAFTTDIDGDIRNNASNDAWDIGADEYMGDIATCSSQDGACCSETESCIGGSFTIASDCSRCCVGGGTCSDVTPPERTKGSPSGSLSYGTTNTVLSMQTNETATCKYSTQSDLNYSSMPNTFSNTGGTSHDTTISGLQNDSSYTYYIRCKDAAGNKNANDYTVSFSVASYLNIPLNIKDVSGVNRSGENGLVSSGVPLPEGMLDEPTGIAVYDQSGNTIPAQFKVLERWRGHDKDESVKWLLVTFFGDVSANGEVTYYLKEGSNPQPANPVSVTDTGSAYQTGNHTFSKNFSGELDFVFTKPNGVKVHASDLPTIEWEVMENGPVRTMLKAQSMTERSNTESQDKFGFTAYIYGYSKSNRWDMTVVLKNTPQTVDYQTSYGPLYFKDFSVKWHQNGTSYILGGGSGDTQSGTLNAGDASYVYQDSSGTDKWQQLGEHDKGDGAYVRNWSDKWKNGIPEFRGYKIKNNSGAELASGDHALGWAELGSAGMGMRYFWQQFPKAVEVQKDALIARLWPKYWQGHNGNHWLDDAQRKAHDLTFRTDGFSEQDAKAFNNPLVIHCGLDWYQETKAIGYISEDASITTNPDPSNIGNWEYNWLMWGGNYLDRIKRRYHQNPMDPFIKNGDPYDAYRTRISMRHSSGITPLWIDNYSYPEDRNKLDEACYTCPFRGPGSYTSGTSRHGFQPWNQQHWTVQEIFDGWRLFGDPLAYDATEKMAYHNQFWVDYRQNKGLNESRQDALPQNVLVEAYRITGDEGMKSSLKEYTDIMWDTINKKRGYYAPHTRNDYVKGMDKPMMLGYLAEGLEATYSVTGEEKIRDMIIGTTDYVMDESYISPCYGAMYESPIDLNELEQAREEALNSLRMKCDCSEYEWGSDLWKSCSSYSEWRILSSLDISYRLTGRDKYIDSFHKVLDGAKQKLDDEYKSRLHVWNNSFDMLEEDPPADTTPPPSIQDLTAQNVGEGFVQLTWSAPQGADSYQLKHAPQPIVENRTSVDGATVSIASNKANWWAAENVSGEPTPASSGTQQSMTISGLEPGVYHFVIRSYDNADNLSDMSNQISLTVGDYYAITTTDLPAANQGASYSETLSVGGGTSPYSWSLSAGSLPSGLSLDNATGDITGTPATTGEYTFTVEVVDGEGRVADKQLSLTVSQPGSSFDLDGDGRINAGDFGELVTHWFRRNLNTLDLNNDGRINVKDLGVLMSNWGN